MNDDVAQGRRETETSLPSQAEVEDLSLVSPTTMLLLCILCESRVLNSRERGVGETSRGQRASELHT
jgi:hypothetical protein